MVNTVILPKPVGITENTVKDYIGQVLPVQNVPDVRYLVTDAQIFKQNKVPMVQLTLEELRAGE